MDSISFFKVSREVQPGAHCNTAILGVVENKRKLYYGDCTENLLPHTLTSETLSFGWL